MHSYKVWSACFLLHADEADFQTLRPLIKIRVDLRCARIGVIRVLFYGTLTTLIKIRVNLYCLGIRVISVIF